METNNKPRIIINASNIHELACILQNKCPVLNNVSHLVNQSEGNEIIHAQCTCVDIIVVVNCPGEKQKEDTIGIHNAAFIQIIKIDKVVHINGQGHLTNFHFIDGNDILYSGTLAEYEEILSHSGYYFRCHRSHIINIHYIDKYHAVINGTVTMTDGSKVPVSVDFREPLLAIINNLPKNN